MFSSSPSGSDVASGLLEAERYPDVARQVVGQFPNIKMVAALRQSLSASFNRWGAMLYDAQSDQPFFSITNDGVYQPFEIKMLSTVLVVEIRSLPGLILLSDRMNIKISNRYSTMQLQLPAWLIH